MNTVVQCLEVDYKAQKAEDFFDIQLEVVGNETLDQSLQNLLVKEKLVGQNKYDSGEHGLQDSVKFNELVALPPIITLHLKRYKYDLEA